ncbi:hypothetical protein FACS189449_05770 [Alphaproteobacteria bacterium]|nr:hypothetical protein FACS189449_05770 [Alphaproteobacteria bacterium]
MEVYPVDYLAWFEKTCEDLDLTTIDYSVDNRCPFSRGEYARIRGTVEGLIQVLRDLAKK